ncbi:MAG: glycosyltransferase [Geobacteraceae bacterium]|nr:glycosyltransferase [Geobacteraceae bacterium]
MANPITIMHLRASNFVGGPEKQILEHFGRLDPERFTPVLGTFVEGDSDPLGDAAVARGFQAVRMNARSPLNPASVYHLSHTLKQHKVDILCTHGYKPNILGCLATSFTRIPNIAISRGWTWESPKIRFYEALDRLFLKFSDHVVAVSNGQQQKIRACGVNPEKLSVIHNAINLNEAVKKADNSIRNELALPDDALIVASAGRLSPEKNYATMIEVAQQVCKENRQVYFMVFGEGFLRPELQQKIHAAGLDRRFFLPGFRKDLQSLLPQIDIFMLPSFTEGLPNVALEAFANNKPIVATAVGGTPEVVQDKVSGFLTEPEDVATMVTSIKKLLDDPGLRNQMGTAGYYYVETNFGFSAQTAAYERLYTGLYQAKRG